MDSIQLNLFGDILVFDDTPPLREVENAAKSLGESGQKTLEGIPSKPLSEIGEGRDSGAGTSEGRGSGSGDDRRVGGKRNAYERSTGDSSPSVHLSDSGAQRKLSTFYLSNFITNNDSPNLFISAEDIENVINQYANKGAGFNDKIGKTVGVSASLRPIMGKKLWEEMKEEEKRQEISEYIYNDLQIASEEIKQNNPVDYLLNRATDPLDPMREIYLVVLKNAGVKVTDKKITLNDNLNNLLTENSIDSSVSLRSPGTFRNSHTDDKNNYHITPEDHIGAGGKVAKFEANLAAITLLKKLNSEKRYATPEEQSVLVKYNGWGGLSEVFKKDLSGPWLERQNSLKDVLSPEEYNSASRSTLNAHYSDPQVINSIWNAVTRMGYNGGPTFEPAAGIGHFFGTRPIHLPIEMHGIELDPISGRIAQQLYQSADIKITGYEDFKIPENRYNLIISNVPFGDYKPYEDKKNQTPGLDNRYSIHDFYFLKSLHGVREGGLVVFITSRYTLDKLDTEVREKIAQKADFIGAIRLPKNSFKQIADTEVVTDIVFLQKRPSNKEMSGLTKEFINTSPISIPSLDGSHIDFSINQYFVNHPEMVLGSHDLNGSMYSGNEYTVSLPEIDQLSKRLNCAVQNLPEGNYNITVDKKTEELDSSYSKPFSHLNTEDVPYGSFIVGSDNRLYQKDIDTGKVIPSPLYEKEVENSFEIRRIIQMSHIRDCVKQAIDHYHNGQQLQVESDISKLNSFYDSFVGEFGFLNSRKNVAAFSNDPDSSLLHSLEIWNPKTKTAKKADIFHGITFVRKESPTHVDSPIDAMILSLSRYGKLDLSYMESLTGENKSTLVDSLISSGHIFQDPYDYLYNNRNTYLTGDEYLSGNIREKLKYAHTAAEKNPALFSRNVNELSEVLPKDLAPQDISIRLNSPILGKDHVKRFISDLLEVRSDRVDVVHVPITGKWEINVRFRHSWEKTVNEETYGTSRMSATDIINNIMNGKAIKLYSKGEHPDDKPVLDQEATSAAELKAEEINKAFNSWVWRDQERTDDIVRRYNEVYNSCVERNFNHPERIANPNAQVWMHGCNFPFPLRAPQADAVWRNLQQSNTMLAHTVGSGKTLEIACSAMELRRLGLRNKPMIVCPDHMIGQWATEFRSAYPAAKLLVADDNNWDKENRRVFMNKIATGDWDAIIIRSESFKMIPMSPEYQEKFYDKKIAEYREILDQVDSSQKKSRSVKDLEKAIEKYELKIKELTDVNKDEGVIPFDKLGVDHLFVDEADIFKNLEYYTQLQNVRGLGTPTGSERAMDMLMKIRHVQDQGGGVTFATGTPISNTLVEAYTMQRYLQPEVLKANGLEAFDEWARQYAETVTQMELNNTGTGYTPVTRFSKIVNVPELVSSLRMVWDIQTAKNLEDNGILVPGINLPHMKIINEAAPSTLLLCSYLKHRCHEFISGR
jgi:N12 class adenine-specific DNA methylase